MANNPPPRLSKSYLFGLSNKPWKDPPKPPPMDSWKGMLGTPGAALEWVASDGRRGALTSKGKLRGVKAALDAAVAAKGQSKADAGQSVAKQDNKDGKGGNEASRDTGGQANGDGEVEYKKIPDPNWTDEEDRTLMRMKAEDKSWNDIIDAIGNGKDKKACIDRFKQIMPDGFFQDKGKGGNKGGEKGSKQGKDKNEKQNKQEQQKKEKEEDKKEETSGGHDPWGVSFDMFDQGRDNKSNASDKGSKKDGKGGTGGADNNAWGATGDTPWGDTTGNEDTGGGNPWGTGDSAGGGWPTGNNNAGGAPGWDNSGGDDWGAGAEKDGKKTDEKKRKKDAKSGKKEVKKKGEWKKNDTKAAGDGWSTGDNPWGAGSNKDNKSDGKSKPSSSSSSISGNNDSGAAPGWGDDNGAGGGGRNDWNAGVGAGGWGDSMPQKKHSKDKSTKKNDEKADGPWNAISRGGAASYKKASSRSPSMERKNHRSDKHSLRRDADFKERHKSCRYHSSSHSTEYKVAPDDTFSQDELKLIARILQQDCSMVWERVSWRFKDKTGRNLHPDVFEKKITGRLEKERRH